MQAYEAWFDSYGMTRIVVIAAESPQQAYRAAKGVVREGEVIRGVTEMDETVEDIAAIEEVVYA